MIRRPPRSTPLYSSAASDVYKRQGPDRPLLDPLWQRRTFHHSQKLLGEPGRRMLFMYLHAKAAKTTLGIRTDLNRKTGNPQRFHRHSQRLLQLRRIGV